MKYVFLRTSTTDQNPALQLNDIIKTFSLIDFTVIQETVSAFKENTKRPEFEKLKKLIVSGNVTQLFVWDLDRLFRNRKRLIEFLALCKIQKTIVFSFNQQWIQAIQQLHPPFDEIMFDFMLSIIGWLGEDESNKKSKRVKLAIRRTENGTISYKGNKWGRKPLSSQVVSKIKELRLQGMSIREIAKLVKVYDKYNNGKLISKSAVHKIINPI